MMLDRMPSFDHCCIGTREVSSNVGKECKECNRRKEAVFTIVY